MEYYFHINGDWYQAHNTSSPSSLQIRKGVKIKALYPDTCPSFILPEIEILFYYLLFEAVEKMKIRINFLKLLFPFAKI